MKRRFKKKSLERKSIKEFRKNKSNYKICFEYLSESKNYIILSTVLFVLFCFIGFAGIGLEQGVEEKIIELISNLIKKTENMNFFQLMIFIIHNNLFTSFLGLMLGIILGIFPILTLIVNGYIIGFVSKKAVEAVGYVSLFKLLPHGIFELPAVIISIALGIKLGMFIFTENKKDYLKYNFENSLRVFLFIVVPLIIVAGIIETTLIFLFK